MGIVTIEQIHDDLIGIKRELQHIRHLVEEDHELANDVVKEIEESRGRSPKEMISHEEIRKEFGA